MVWLQKNARRRSLAPTIRKLLRFMRLRMVFSICETRKKMRKSSRSFSSVANSADEDP